MNPLYLDMDPGIDDAMALILATGIAVIEGLTTVAGNVDGDRTYRNAWHILKKIGQQNIPLIQGSSRPLFYPLDSAAHIHGVEGLGNDSPQDADVPLSSYKAWHWLAQKWHESPHAVDVVATGPLTNLARLSLAYPDAFNAVARVIIMGGSLSGGNVTSTAEFNFYADPDSAEIVLRDVPKVEMIGLDVTRQSGLDESDRARLLEFGAIGQWLYDLLGFYAEQIRRAGAPSDRLVVHDAVALFAWHHPEAFQWQAVRLGVVREGVWRGTVVADPRDLSRPQVRVATSLDREQFVQWIFDGLAQVRDRDGKFS